MGEYNYYNMAEMLEFLGIKYDFEKNGGTIYPFGDKPSDIVFNYGYIIIPREGIEEIIQNKISDKDYQGILEEIKMLVHIPFYCKRTRNTGTIMVDVSVTRFRCDKEYRYGDVKKSLPEVCYAIEKYGEKTNDFYIIDDEFNYFMSNYVMDNQWRIGARKVVSSPKVNVDDNFEEIRENF